LSMFPPGSWRACWRGPRNNKISLYVVRVRPVVWALERATCKQGQVKNRGRLLRAPYLVCGAFQAKSGGRTSMKGQHHAAEETTAPGPADGQERPPGRPVDPAEHCTGAPPQATPTKGPAPAAETCRRRRPGTGHYESLHRTAGLRPVKPHGLPARGRYGCGARPLARLCLVAQEGRAMLTGTNYKTMLCSFGGQVGHGSLFSGRS